MGLVAVPLGKVPLQLLLKGSNSHKNELGSVAVILRELTMIGAEVRSASSRRSCNGARESDDERDYYRRFVLCSTALKRLPGVPISKYL